MVLLILQNGPPQGVFANVQKYRGVFAKLRVQSASTSTENGLTGGVSDLSAPDDELCDQKIQLSRCVT